MVQTTKKAELIFSGRTLPRAEAYIPAGNIKQQGIEKAYCDARGYNAYKSEERKKAILAEISSIRAEMRAIATSNRPFIEKVKYADYEEYQQKAPIANKPWPIMAKRAIGTLEKINTFVEELFSNTPQRVHLHDIRNYTISN